MRCAFILAGDHCESDSVEANISAEQIPARLLGHVSVFQSYNKKPAWSWLQEASMLVLTSWPAFPS